jgi:prepilin-type N-terminal cleavage/methylation domain-containing protein
MSITSALAAHRAHPGAGTGTDAGKGTDAGRDAGRGTDAGKDAGFTLIELLIVVVIIGILAGIAVPVFIGQQDQAKNAAATSDLANLRLAMVGYSIDHDGDYTNSTGDLTDYGFVSSTEAVPFIQVRHQRFCIQLASDSSAPFYATDKASVQAGTCATSGDPMFTPRRDRGNRIPRSP